MPFMSERDIVGRVVVERLGGPDVLAWDEHELPPPGNGEVRVRHAAVGLNFVDVYFRTGLYAGPELPFVPGMEASGVVEAVGPGVSGVAVGDRVAYACRPLGAYAEARLIPADRLVRVPPGVELRTAAAAMLKGMTAEYLLFRTFPVERGQTILVHAAAGGVGLILCQWAKHLGATVIGTVGSDEKARLARDNGCDHPIVYTRENVAERVRAITQGKGVPVVYDSVGRDTFSASLDSLAPRGLFVSYGQSSGELASLDPQLLSAKGSLFFTRPTMMNYTASREDLVLSSGRLFDAIERGVVSIHVGQTYPLRDAARAHRDLEARKTTGSTLLLPEGPAS
jgi:NADPH2:quinone reductase